MKINDLIQSSLNIRKSYPTELVNDLANSVAEDGLLSKMVLRKSKEHPGKYEVLAGWRRRMALSAILNGGEFAEVPEDYYVVRDVSDFDGLRMSISENVQRISLSSLELAYAVKNLKEKKPKVTVKEIAKILWTTDARVKRLSNLDEVMEELPSIAIESLSTPDELEPTFTDLHVEAMRKAGAFNLGSGTVKDVCEMIMDNEWPASKVEEAIARCTKEVNAEKGPEGLDPVGASGEAAEDNDGPMCDKFNGELKLEEGQLIVESKREVTKLDLKYYEEYLKNPGKFKIYLSGKITIKPIED